eukprot:scaffold100236_cov64-Phaeocystis_antarctica.AAC.2
MCVEPRPCTRRGRSSPGVAYRAILVGLGAEGSLRAANKIQKVLGVLRLQARAGHGAADSMGTDGFPRSGLEAGGVSLEEAGMHGGLLARSGAPRAMSAERAISCGHSPQLHSLQFPAEIRCNLPPLVRLRCGMQMQRQVAAPEVALQIARTDAASRKACRGVHAHAAAAARRGQRK